MNESFGNKPPAQQRMTQTQTVNVGDEPIFDLKAAGYFIGFVMRSIRRRTRLLVTLCVVCLALSTVVAAISPKVYKISSRVLTRRNLVMAQIANPDRSISSQADNPTAGAVELIKSRENLENLMTDVDLQKVWEEKRSTFYRFKDRVMGTFVKASRQDVHESFLKLLEERIVAQVSEDVVLMDVEWPDPDIAMRLAEGVVSRFMKTRHDMELSEILSSVSILERNVDASRKGIEEAVSRMQKIFNEKERQMRPSTGSETRRKHRNRVVAIRRPQAAAHTDAGVEDLRRAFADKQEAIERIKRLQAERLKKSQEELNQLRATLGPDHPDFQDARRSVEALQQPAPELLALQAEAERLAGQLGAQAPQGPARDQPRVAVDTGEVAEASAEESGQDMMKVAVSEELYEELGKDPEIVSIMEEIGKKQDTHDALIKRLSNARIESETANVAFEYRYLIVAPPVYPKKSIRPNVPLMIGGGAVVGLILGMVFAVAADILSKRILEAWQIQRFLDVPCLGEIEEM